MKDSRNSIIGFHITLYFLFIFILNILHVFATVPTRHLCHSDQRDAIVEFKNEFKILKPCFDSPSPLKTASWAKNSDCCYWDGITCNNKSGDVIELDLSFNCLHGLVNSKRSILSLQTLRFLTTLRLSNNYLSGQIPSSFGSLSNLTTLDLYSNYFSGRIPSSLGNLSHLTSLVLSFNSFVGEIPFSLGNLSHLTYLDLSINDFSGTLPSSLFTVPSLDTICLENNQFNGTLVLGNISSSSKLVELRLGSNNFIGPLPRDVSKFVKLELLDLSHFNTQGSVDFSIFSHLKSLRNLYLSHLNTTTMIDLIEMLSCFKALDTLDLSGNHVSTKNKSSFSTPPLVLISVLYLSECGIIEFPEILRTLHKMTNLDISNNKIKGQVPGWLWTLSDLMIVNLSNNSFIGFKRSTKTGLSATASESSMMYLFASNNNFTGKIPSFICALRSLRTIDLSNNNFVGRIPRCMVNLKGTLSALNLRQNRLSGGLPHIIFGSMKSLDIGRNQLVGKLPRSLSRLSFLEVLNVESNKINDTFPYWLSSLQNLQVLVLRSNAFYGPVQLSQFPKLQIIDISHNHFNGILPSDCFVNWTSMFALGKNEDQYISIGYYFASMVLMNKGIEMELLRVPKIFTAIDFSGNKFEGEIPKSISLLKELHVLNLSNNAFIGHIASSMRNLTALESLDVSQNKLSGKIPQELGKLSYLAYMNFSHNQLVGEVPGGTQFRRQPCSSFEENMGLYGPSLDEVCVDFHSKTTGEADTPELEANKDEEEVLSWIATIIGFILGIAFGLTIAYIMFSYKPKWFKNPF
ncbi:hypothetical protein CARUB_v10015150mg [Capsella rubella]|uniref:Uncharacterized protein n=1 Tax=Capsella rubella TaxID=81985 RepID=R0HZY0_9BRAS|nr:hypothetical protein CARUB_v10015150mg [Capsella rubella]